MNQSTETKELTAAEQRAAGMGGSYSIDPVTRAVTLEHRTQAPAETPVRTATQLTTDDGEPTEDGESFHDEYRREPIARAEKPAADSATTNEDLGAE